MKIFRIAFLLFILSFVLIEGLYSQEIKEDEVVVLQGEKFVLHQVRTGETIYSISRNFNVERSELIKNNPKISEGLDIGEMLKIPYRENVELNQGGVVNKGDPTKFEFYKIKSRKETPYYIAKMHDITVEELYAYNPTIRKFKKGTKIRIPIWEEFVKEAVTKELVAEEISQPNIIEGEKVVHTVISGETLYFISQTYGVSESEILFYNPDAKNLKAGAKLNIPVKKVEREEFVEETETTTSSGGIYFDHIVESGETLWGTTRKYKVSEEELKELNPALRTGFQAGVIIKIPVKNEVAETQAQPVNDDAFFKHLVLSGESLWGLAHEYNLKIPDIQKYNPVLENRNLVAGETILIPKKIMEESVRFEVEDKADSIARVEAYYEVELPIEVPHFCKPNEFTSFSNETYKVALFLPLYLEANATLNRETEMQDLLDSLALAEKNVEVVEEVSQDPTIEKEEPKELFKQFYGGSENYVQFYEGVLLAVDKMQKNGMKVIVNVFDTQRNPDSIRQFIYTEDFLETDLIIGPVLESVQKDVAQIAAKNRIPIVSPLASESDITENNPHYYQVVPSRKYIAEKTAEMVAEEYYNSNFIVVKTREYKGTIEGEMVDLIQEKMFNSGFLSQRDGVSFTIYDFENEGPFGLRRIMSKRKENVVLIPSMDEGELSVAISNVNNLADDYSITLIGSNRYQRNESINIEQYHNLKMRYVAPYWLDYEDLSAIQFIDKFKAEFKTEPNNYGVQGYDVALYFLNALKVYGKDFEDCLPYLRVNLVQGNYHFEKISQFGGYMNQGVSIISYNKNFEVSRKRIKGQPKLVVIAEN